MTKRPSESGEQSPWLEADEIKESVSVEDVLAYYGMLDSLKRKGTRLKGISPFREDRHPSFSVDTAENRWNDFSGRPLGPNGKPVPGNIFGLVMAFENCSFREALLKLHEQHAFQDRKRVKTTLEKNSNRPKKPEIAENVPFSRELRGRTNIPFLLDKGITEETIKKFRVVYCSAGLMKGRIAYPVRNVRDEIMFYLGRAVKKTDEEENGKYKIPPRVNKASELFNINRIANDPEAKKTTKDFGLIVVEGPNDAMKLHQEHFKNVVALMGTTMSKIQKALMLDPKLNPTRRLTLFLDNDEAGHEGKRRIATECIHDGFLRYVDWSRAPDGKTEPEQFFREELATLLGYKT